MEIISGEVASYQAKFNTYLLEQKYAEPSVKSMGDDLASFFSWFASKSAFSGFRLSQGNRLSAIFTSRALEQYFDFCRANFSPSAASRKTAVLFSFCQYAVENKWLSSKLLTVLQNLADKRTRLLKTDEDILAEFKLSLQRSQNNPNTVRGYLADVAEFLQVNSR